MALVHIIIPKEAVRKQEETGRLIEEMKSRSGLKDIDKKRDDPWRQQRPP